MENLKQKNLEDVLKEVGSGTETNMTRIENELVSARGTKTNLNARLEEDKTSLLNKLEKTNASLSEYAKNLIPKTDIIALKNKEWVKDDYNNYVKLGIYMMGNNAEILNSPPINWGFLEVISDGDFIVQKAITIAIDGIHPRGTIITRGRDEHGNWSGWKQLATTETATLTLLNGWVASRTSVDFKVARVGNQVTLNGAIKGGIITNGTTIANLPIQYRTGRQIVWNGVQGTSIVNGDIGENGDMRIWGTWNNTTEAVIMISYVV